MKLPIAERNTPFSMWKCFQQDLSSRCYVLKCRFTNRVFDNISQNDYQYGIQHYLAEQSWGESHDGDYRCWNLRHVNVMFPSHIQCKADWLTTAGICIAIDLLRQDEASKFVMIEKGNQIGGTWNDNQVYPSVPFFAFHYMTDPLTSILAAAVTSGVIYTPSLSSQILNGHESIQAKKRSTST